MRKALIIGINKYPAAPLYGCIRDAESLAGLLQKNGDQSFNFDISLQRDIPTKNDLAAMVHQHFQGGNDVDISVLYFSGHGSVNEVDSFLVTPDFKRFDPGLSLSHLMLMANESKHRNRVIILDCCHAGSAGNIAVMGGGASILNSGVTILAASKPDEVAMESGGGGIFTNLLLQALEGGAADICGNITPAGIYAYIDQALGALSQRPVFKANTTAFIPLRKIRPRISPETLKNISNYFADPQQDRPLDPSYEFTNSDQYNHERKPPFAQPGNVEIFKSLQQLAGVGLVVPVGAPHMYFAAMEGKACRLTPLGMHYWRLVRENRI